MSTAAAKSSASEAQSDVIPLSDVLQKLSGSLLSEFASGVNVKTKASASKKTIAEALVNEAYTQGTQLLFKQLDKDQLKATVEALGLTADTQDKSKLLKKINEKLKEQKTLDDFLDQLTKEVLLEFCKALDFEEDTNDKGALINAVSDETIIAGMRHLFDKMTKEFLEDVAKAVGAKMSGTKKDLINRVLGLSYKQLLEEKATKDEKEKRTDRTHLDIKKGATMEELFQTYYASELRNYCREHDLLLSGSRRDMCKRIVAFVNGDETSTKKGATKKRKRSDKSKKDKKGKKKEEEKKDEKKSEAKKEDEAAKPAEKKDTTTTAAEKKSAPAEEKKDAAAAASSSAAAPAAPAAPAAAAENKSERPPSKRTKK